MSADHAPGGLASSVRSALDARWAGRSTGGRRAAGTGQDEEQRRAQLLRNGRTVRCAQGAAHRAQDLQLQGIICPYVFHRPDGSQIKDFRALWRTACEKAGHQGKLFHDFRRSAVRTLERSGVPRSTAMAMVGHKTESIYRRYAIVDEAMHREAAAKLDLWAVEQQAKAEAERKGQLKRFKRKSAR